MSPEKLRLLEDRALRDAARAVVKQDVAFLKAEVDEQGIGSRVLDTGLDYARTMADGALDLAGDNKGKLAGGLGLALAGIAAWIFRDEIGQFVAGMVEGTFGSNDEEDAEQEADIAGSGED